MNKRQKINVLLNNETIINKTNENKLIYYTREIISMWCVKNDILNKLIKTNENWSIN